MAKAAKGKRITVTLEVEPPYTGFAVLTFGGSDGALKITSKPIKLNHKSVVLVGENGGIFQMTTKEWEHREGLAGKNGENEKNGRKVKDTEQDEDDQ